MRNWQLSALALWAAGCAQSAWAAQPVEELSSTAPWVARFDENACHLIGQFGSGDASVMMRMTRYAPTASFDLRLYGKRFDGIDSTLRGGVTFDPAARIAREDRLAGKAGKLPMVIIGSTRLDGWRSAKPDDIGPAITPAMESAVKTMDIEFAGKKRVRLLTGSMGRAMATMRSCMDSLIKSWGFDPAVQGSLSRGLQPTNSPAFWLKSDDYPSKALDNGHNGIVDFRLDVDSSGKVENCHILSATKPSDFEMATCKGITRRARFLPALDAQGQPVRSFYVNSVKWLAG